MKPLLFSEELKIGSSNFKMNNNIYIFDLNAIMDFILKNDDSRTSNSEITEMYLQDEESSDMVLTSKQLREIKNNGDSSTYTLRYDLVKTLITILDEIEEENIENSSFMQKMAFNSMLTQGLIKVIKTE